MSGGVGLASVWGSRAEAVCEHWPAVLKPCGLVHFYPAAAGGYEGHLPGVDHTVGKLHRQQLDRNHLRLRTRLKRLAGKTLGFSKSVLIHDIVIGLFVNRYEFGNLVSTTPSTIPEHYPHARVNLLSPGGDSRGKHPRPLSRPQI